MGKWRMKNRDFRWITFLTLSVSERKSWFRAVSFCCSCELSTKRPLTRFSSSRSLDSAFCRASRSFSRRDWASDFLNSKHNKFVCAQTLLSLCAVITCRYGIKSNLTNQYSLNHWFHQVGTHVIFPYDIHIYRTNFLYFEREGITELPLPAKN